MPAPGIKKPASDSTFAFVSYSRAVLRVCILALPLMGYQFGTMLLLTGSDWRFFYITVLLGGAVCLAMVSTQKQND